MRNKILTSRIFLVLKVQASHSPNRRSDHGLEKQVSFVPVDKVSFVEGVIRVLDKLPVSASVPENRNVNSEMFEFTCALLDQASI